MTIELFQLLPKTQSRLFITVLFIVSFSSCVIIMASASQTTFFTKLEQRVHEINSHLCVGLDPHLKELFPELKDDSEALSQKTEEERCDAAFTFCKNLIDATVPHTAAYKPNAAFFEALGPNLGMTTLRRVIDAIPSSIPVLLDVKRGDIGSTAQAYAEACYDDKNGLNADGVTLSPLMGWDSVEPFISGVYNSKGAFILCKTSNPGSNDLLSLGLNSGDNDGYDTLFEKIASFAQIWSDKASSSSKEQQQEQQPPLLGLVVGATDPEALTKARKAAGEHVWILAPGVGAQGGDLEAALGAGMNANATGMLIPVSRGISRADNPGKKAGELKDSINVARNAILEVTKNTDDDQEVCTDDKIMTTIAPYQKDFLEFSLEQGVLRFGSFVLKSGRTSPYFFNAGLFASGAALFKLGRAYAAAIMASKELTDENGNVSFDIIFGPAYKGISLGAVVCAALYNDYGVDVGFAYDRKEAKSHGEGGKLVGASMENKRILVVDDVITAGTAIRQSYEMLSTVKAKAVGVAIALDRAEKKSLDDPISAVQAVARDLQLPVVSIVSLPQLQSFLQKSPDYDDDILASVTKYRAEYGV